MGGDHGRKQQEAALEAAATSAQNKASASNPYFDKVAAHLSALDDWRSGKLGPIDVRNMPDSGVAIDLFNKAKESTDAGRVGRGYGTLSDGGNADFAARLGQENDMTRSLAASGGLENYVQGELSGLDSGLMGLSGAETARDSSAASLALSRLNTLYQKPKQGNFLKDLALGLAGNVSYAKGAFAI
jgi:hypothetical protein